MPKKKKAPLTAAQKRKNRLDTALNGAQTFGRAFRERASTAGTAANGVCARANAAVRRFLGFQWSTAVLTVFFLLLMWVTNLLMDRHILTETFPLAFPISFPFYLIDYKVGFVSRALVGQIVSFFTNSVSVNLMLAIARTVTALSLAVRAGLAAGTFRRAFLKGSPLICVLCCYFVISPLTVMGYQIYLGFMDPYNMILTVLYLFVSGKKAAYILTPLICFTGIVLHYQFILIFLPLILSVELYYMCMDKKGRGLKIASLCVTVLGSAALTAYLMFFSKNGVTMNAEELYAYMCGKFSDYRRWGLFEEYFTYYIYGDFQGENFSNPLAFVRFLVEYNLERVSTYSLLGYAAGILPLVFFTEYFWLRMFRHARGEKKLPYLVFALQPLILIATLATSTDNGRLFGASIFSNFALLYVTCRNEDDLLYPTAKKAEKPVWLILALAAMAAGYLISMDRINHRFI